MGAQSSGGTLFRARHAAVGRAHGQDPAADSVRIYHFCQDCEAKLEIHGRGRATEEAEPRWNSRRAVAGTGEVRLPAANATRHSSLKRRLHPNPGSVSGGWTLSKQ